MSTIYKGLSKMNVNFPAEGVAIDALRNLAVVSVTTY